MTSPVYPVQVVTAAGALVLDLNPPDYATDVRGLHDLPDREAVMSAGYASGAELLDSRDLPRAFTMLIAVRAGMDTLPIRNAAHNAARDAVIRAFPRGRLIYLRTQYIGTAGSYDIAAFVQNLQWQPGTRSYLATLTAPKPALKRTVVSTTGVQTLPVASGVVITALSAANPTHVTTSTAHGLSTGDSIRITGTGRAGIDNKYWIVTVLDATHFTIPILDLGGSGLNATFARPNRTLTVTPGGNTDTYPVILITPTANKTERWQYRRRYTVLNNADKQLIAYPVALAFPFATLLGAGKIKGDGGDIRVLANAQFMNRWWSGPIGTATQIWVELDIPAGASVDVEVLYGFTAMPDAQTWVNTTAGPIFDLATSTNGIVRYSGQFMDVPGAPTTRSAKWDLHQAQSQGMSGIRRHLPPPWPAGGGSYVNAAGGEIPASVEVSGYAGMAIHHPLGILTVIYSGRTRLDTGVAKFLLRTYNDLTGSLTDYDPGLPNTSGAEAFFGPITVGPLGTAADAVVLALRSLTVHQGVAGYIGGAYDVQLVINPAPTVTAFAEDAIYMLEMSIINYTTGHGITLFGRVLQSGGVWSTVIVNVEAQTIVEGVNNFFYARNLIPPIRSEWMLLQSGANTIAIRDEGAIGIGVEIRWQDRRL